MDIFYYAIIMLCPVNIVCDTSDKFIRYFSEPFVIEQEEAKNGWIVGERCKKAVRKLRNNITIDGRQSTICVQKDIWDRMHRNDTQG
tara:strand:- start:146 stop:406 length:261 start_codon:yes stop_codon:yes gene_type:complete